MNHSTASSNPPFILARLVNQYVLASSLFALLIIAGYFLIQWTLSQHASDVHIINLAGQQRMLSNNLSKTALLIQITTNAQERAGYLDKLNQLLNLLEKYHQRLQFGNADMGLPSSATVTRQFAELQPHSHAMNVAAEQLLAVAQQHAADLDNSGEIAGLVKQIVAEQKAFAQQMDVIIFQYETEATAHLNQAKWLSTLVVIITLIVLLLEGLYLFRPAVRKIPQILLDSLKAKAQIPEKETLLQAILDNLPSAIYVKDIQGRYLFINRQFERLVHLTKAEIIGKTDEEIFPAEHFQAQDIKALEANTPIQFDKKMPLEEGLYTYIATRLYAPNGNIYAVCGISTTMTHRQQAEDALPESEAMLRALLNAIPESAFLLDNNGIVLSANETTVQRLNTTLERFVGTQVYDWLPPEVAESRNKQLDKVLESRQPLHFEDMRDGRYFHTFICPVASQEKAITKVAVVGIDITEYKQTQIELSKLNDELEARVFQRTRQLEITNQELKAEIAFRHQTEMALKVSEERYRRIVETAQEGIWIIDAEAKTTFVNQRMADMLGYRIEEMQGRPMYDFMDEVACIEAERYFERRKQGIKEQHDFRFCRQDGSALWVIINTNPFMDDKGEFLCALGMITDITKRKRAETERQESLNLLQTVLSSLNEAVVIVDFAAGRIEECNKTTDLMFGYTREELLNQPISLLHVNEEQFTQFEQEVELNIKTQGFFTTAYQLKRQNGEIFPTECYVTSLSEEQGKMTKAVCVIHDITERKLAEDVLRESEERYRRIVETAQEGIWIIDAEAKTTFVNQRMADMLGYRIEEMQNRPMYDFMDEVACLEAERNFERRKQGIGERHDFRFRHKSGSDLWTIISAAPFFEVQGEFLGALGMVVDITERKQMEEQLRHSEELHRVILNSISDAVLLTDDNGRFTYICSNIESIFGFSIKEIQAFGNISRLLPDNAISLDDLKRLGELQNVECEMRNKSGQILSLLVNVKRVSIKEGTILYTCRDVTQRKRAEQNFRQLLESAPDAMVIFNQQGTIVLVNVQTEKLFGYARANLLGKPVEILIPERYRHLHNLQWDNYFNEPRPRPMGSDIEFYALRQDGCEFPVEISLSPIETAEGLLVSSTIRDITDRKQAEETLRNLVEGVSATTGTNFLQKLVEYLAHMLKVKYAFIGQLLADKPKTLRTLVIVADNRLIDNVEYDLRNTPCEKVITGEAPCCYCPQGIQQCFRNSLLVQMAIENCIVTPLVDAHGQVMGLIAIMDDKPLNQKERIESLLQIFSARAAAELERIHALEALEQERSSLAQRVEERTAELMSANMELARAVRLKDEFLANMSHELRTPLNAILGMSEVLQEGSYGSINQQQAKSLRIIKESGKHLLSLVNDILDLAKMDAGKVKLEILPVSAEGIANTCLHIVKELALKKRLKLSTTFDIAVTIIQADERYLKQMLINLLSNAIKFTPEKGMVNLEIRGNAKQGIVEFIVSDTGIGIHEKDMEYLFKPFVQLDGGLNRRYEGTGLGLSLVSRLAEMHGGGVSVESEVGKGSRFSILLPWQPKDEEPPPDKHSSQSAEAVNLLLHTSAVILLVDDNPTVIETLYDYLKTKGYQVITAYNGIQAIDKAREVHPNLILMDIQMPTMNGLEATRRIRAYAKMATIPIIALTALAMPGDKERCLEAGANDYLSKQVNFKTLIAAIERLL
jgi:PAS domain S-box-containing protein